MKILSNLPKLVGIGATALGTSVLLSSTSPKGLTQLPGNLQTKCNTNPTNGIKNCQVPVLNFSNDPNKLNTPPLTPYYDGKTPNYAGEGIMHFTITKPGDIKRLTNLACHGAFYNNGMRPERAINPNQTIYRRLDVVEETKQLSISGTSSQVSPSNSQYFPLPPVDCRNKGK